MKGISYVMSLLDSEKKYWECLSNQHKQLVNLYDEIKSNVCISMESNDITKAILLRMKAYYETQNEIKKFLNKRYLTAGSDFFVETVVFYLKLFFDKSRIDFEVHSERRIRPQRGIIRPDISIWKYDEVIGIIECKTQLGWNDRWDEDFKERESKLKDDFPNAKAFLVIGWPPGFSLDDGRIGNQLFTLSSKYPGRITEEDIDKVIINPI
jgi:hypothetical protein